MASPAPHERMTSCKVQGAAVCPDRNLLGTSKVIDVEKGTFFWFPFNTNHACQSAEGFTHGRTAGSAQGKGTQANPGDADQTPRRGTAFLTVLKGDIKEKHPLIGIPFQD